MKKSDGCTGFFQNWLVYSISWNPFKWFKLKPLKPCCIKHDNIGADTPSCSSHEFAKCLYDNKFVAGIPIFMVASAVCWIRYPKGMVKKL